MIYVGIDIAKQNYVASAVSTDGEIIFEPFGCFTNDNSCFQKLLDNLSYLGKEEMLIGMESTAHYAENFTCFLFSRGFNICIINPIQTAALRKTNFRKTKNDRVDTYLIIKALIMNQYHLFSQRDLQSLILKNLVAFAKNL